MNLLKELRVEAYRSALTNERAGALALLVWVLFGIFAVLGQLRTDWSARRREVLIDSLALYECAAGSERDLRQFGLVVIEGGAERFFIPRADADGERVRGWARAWAAACGSVLAIPRHDDRLVDAATYILDNRFTQRELAHDFESVLDQRWEHVMTLHIPLLGQTVDLNWLGVIYAIGLCALLFWWTLADERSLRLLRQLLDESAEHTEEPGVRDGTETLGLLLALTATVVAVGICVFEVVTAVRVARVFHEKAWLTPVLAMPFTAIAVALLVRVVRGRASLLRPAKSRARSKGAARG